MGQEQTPAKRVLLVVTDGFEDVEAITVVDACGWTQYRPHLSRVTVVVAGFASQVQGRFGTVLPVDVAVAQADAADYDALVIPGGFHGYGFDDIYCDDVRNLAAAFGVQGKPIATMCVGVLPVAEAGVLRGGQATTYSFSSRHDNFGRLEELGCQGTRQPVVESQGVISCSGPAYSEQVAGLLLERLLGPEDAVELAMYRAGLPSCDA